VNSLNDLKFHARHEIGNISISLIQGAGCYGNFPSSFEVLVWDEEGDIPLQNGDNVLGWQTEAEVLALISDIEKSVAYKRDWAGNKRRLFTGSVA
jgi:hypothetical protein